MRGFGVQWKHLICFKYVCHFSWLMFSWERFVIQVRCWASGKGKYLRWVGRKEERQEISGLELLHPAANPSGQESQRARSLPPGQKWSHPMGVTRRRCFFHILTNTSCLWSFCWQSLWMVWGDISLWLWLAFSWESVISIFSWDHQPSLCLLWKVYWILPSIFKSCLLLPRLFFLKEQKWLPFAYIFWIARDSQNDSIVLFKTAVSLPFPSARVKEKHEWWVIQVTVLVSLI